MLRILELCREAAPAGSSWHADLIRRVARAVDERPSILDGNAARAADITRRFRSVAAHAYDTFDQTRAANAAASASVLISLLPSQIGRFRQAIDP